MNLPNVSKDISSDIQKSIKNPEGAISFVYSSERLFDKSISGIIFQVLNGQIIHRLERDSNLMLNFYRSTPGTGTQIATIDLNKLIPSNNIFLTFTWSPIDIHLYAGTDRINLIDCAGKPSAKQFRVDATGCVVQVGDIGVRVMGITVIENGKKILTTTAIQTWEETISTIEFLLKGKSDDGFIFESICTNLSIVILVSGFESYCKRRFLELEDEGIQSNFEELAKKFIPKIEGIDFTQIIKDRAIASGISPTKQIVIEGKINFQNYENCKTAFKRGFDIKFSEDFGIKSDEIKLIKDLFKYRHQVIHVSPLNTFPPINTERNPGEKPPKNEYAQTGIDLMNKFIHALHQVTLNLKSFSK